MNMDDALEYIRYNPDMLQTPIIFEKNKLLVGFHIEEIRQFIPSIYRTEKR